MSSDAEELGHPYLLGHLPQNVKKVIDGPSSTSGSSSRRGQPSRIRDRVPEAEAELADPAVGPNCLKDLHEEMKLPRQFQLEVAHHSRVNVFARHGNEDRYMAEQDVYAPLGLEFHTIGVLDGHDGPDASNLVSRRLPARVSALLKEDVPVVEAYSQALARLEQFLAQYQMTAGTCVLSCTVAGNFIWCANLGDCRAGLFLLQVPPVNAEDTVVPKVTSVHWLSRDHKAGAPRERRRIIEAGGKVIDGRVEGLEPSRTLGDFDVKSIVRPGVISIEPEVRCFELGRDGATTQALLVCATDGVWDTVTGQDVCALISMQEAIADLQLRAHEGSPLSKPALETLAKEIVELSIAKGSADDCTCVVAMISVEPEYSDCGP